MSTEILDARAESVRLSFLAEHPKALDAAVAHVDGATFKVTTAGVACLAVILDGGTRVEFTMTEPEPGRPLVRPLVAAPEVAPLPVADLFDVNRERGRIVKTHLEPLRHLAEQLRLRTRNVATSHSDEVARLGGLVPTDAVDATYRPINYTTTVRRMSREAVETVALLEDLRHVLAEAEAYRRAVGPRLRDAQVALATARSGVDNLAAVPSLVNLGELAVDRYAQAEVNQDDLGDRLDTLRRAVEEAQSLLIRFEEATRIHASAMLETARRFTMATATVTLARLRAEAQAVRVVSEAEMLATEAASRVGVTAPTIAWPADLLEPPRLG